MPIFPSCKPSITALPVSLIAQDPGLLFCWSHHCHGHLHGLLLFLSTPGRAPHHRLTDLPLSPAVAVTQGCATPFPWLHPALRSSAQASTHLALPRPHTAAVCFPIPSTAQPCPAHGSNCNSSTPAQHPRGSRTPLSNQVPLPCSLAEQPTSRPRLSSMRQYMAERLALLVRFLFLPLSTFSLFMIMGM